MAPGWCTCGGFYAHRKCSSKCARPEGPTQRVLRFGQAASEARGLATAAVTRARPEAPALASWPMQVEAMAQQARSEAREA
eukprot:11072392-Alexandrium_andersonii.AAC.1